MGSLHAVASGLAKVDPADGRNAASTEPPRLGPRTRPLSPAARHAQLAANAAYVPTSREIAAQRLNARFTTSVPSSFSGRRTVQPQKLAAGTRSHERRWRDASIFLVERRKGALWKYGSIVLCVALWVEVWLLFTTSMI